MGSWANNQSLCLGLAVAIGGSVTAWSAVPTENPYTIITNRNAFGIHPPPDPEPPPVIAPPSAPPNVFLTGVSHQNGQKRAYFVINRPGTKQPEYETASEGEEIQDLKILEIDAKEGRVRAMIGGREVALNFTDNGLKSTGGAPVPGAQGAPNTGQRPPGSPPPQPIAPVPGATAANSGPVVIGRGGVMNSSQPAVNPAGNYFPAYPDNTAVSGVAGGGQAQPVQQYQPVQPTRQLPTRAGGDSSQVNHDVTQPVGGGTETNPRTGIPIPVPPPSRFQ